MCDYSLMHFPNRLATSGEDLIVHQFVTGCYGLVAPTEMCKKENPKRDSEPGRGFFAKLMQFLNPPDTGMCHVVCMPPGARLLVRDIPEKLQREFGIEQEEVVTFTQITAATSRFRDAIRFANGGEVLLQRLREGQRVHVLSTSVEEEVERPALQAKG